MRATRALGLVGLGLLVVATGACRKPVSVTLGQPFTLHVGQAARVRGGDLDLYFRRVASDSRCPQGAQCIVAGDADVTLEGRIMKGAAESFDVRLAGASAAADTLSRKAYDGYWITLTRLDPPKVVNVATDTTAYVGTFIVEKR